MGINYKIPRTLVKELTKAFGDFSIYLYGSRITGTSHPGSDADLLVLTKKIPSEDEVKKLIKIFSRMKINAFIMSEKTFDQCRNDNFYFASPLEEVARSGVLLLGKKKIKPRMSDLQVTYGTWIITLLQLSHRPFLASPDDAVKILARGTLLVWELEKKIQLKGNFSFGSFLHSVMLDENQIPTNDKLSDYLNESGVLWKWLENTGQDFSLIREWEEEVKERLRPHAHILNHIEIRPIPLEALRFIEGNPLYANVPWHREGKDLTVMADLGERYLINIIKICLKR